MLATAGMAGRVGSLPRRRPESLRQRMHDDRAGHGGDGSGEQGAEVLVDPRQRALVGLLGRLEIWMNKDAR